MFALAMLIALALDALIGWPKAMFRRIGHPVTWIGAVITRLDARWNQKAQSTARRRGMGVLTVLICLALVGALSWSAQSLLPGGIIGTVLIGILAWPLVAARSLHQHVGAVADPLTRGAEADARRAVAMIVGRDPNQLDKAGIARAAIESLAENTSDGVIAPLFWGAIFGLPGIAVYKAINTMDSMIGYKTPRHLAFGWAAARLDDLVNWIPARGTAMLFAAVSGRTPQAWRVARRDARLHRSPNAGWPEGAMAGGLGIRLSGPRIYATGPTDDPWVHAEGTDPGAPDIRAALRLYTRALGLMAALLAVSGMALA